MQSQHGRKKRASERGAEVIEASFIVLPFFALLFLIVDLSLAVWCRCTLQFAVTEGLRYGIVSPNAGQGIDCAVRKNVQYNAMGLLNNASDFAKVKIRFYDAANNLTLIDESGGTVAGADAGGNVMEVSVEDFVWAPLAPLLHDANPFHFTARSLGVIEPPPGGITAARSGASCS